MGEILPYEENIGISMLHQEEGISYQANRWCVNNNVVINLFQAAKHFSAFFRSDQFGGVRRNRSCHDDIQIFNPGVLYYIFKLTFIDKIRGNSFGICKAEILVDLWFPEVETHQKGFLPIQGINGGQVYGNESLTGTDHIGSDKYTDTFFALQKILKIGTNRTKRFSDC